MGRAQNTVKRGTFRWYAVGGVGGRGAPLSYGEERTAVRQGHGQGPLAGLYHYIVELRTPATPVGVGGGIFP